MNQYILGIMHGAALGILWTIATTTSLLYILAIAILLTIVSLIYWVAHLISTMK